MATRRECAAPKEIEALGRAGTLAAIAAGTGRIDRVLAIDFELSGT
jgi:hypothetical protein